MISIKIYDYSDYKSYLRDGVANSEESWGAMTKLAKAAGCQRPYLSRVLNGKSHLSSSQLFGIARFWKLSEEETEYLLGLLEIERSVLLSYKEYWLRKLHEKRKENESLAKKVNRQVISDSSENDLVYYSSWYWTAIHILTSIPQFQTEKSIAEKLSLPIAQVRTVLQTLESWGAVRREEGLWKFGSREQHVSKRSPLAAFHHSNWRNQAILDAQKQTTGGVHFTVVQSLSKRDYEKIKSLVLETIQAISTIAGPSAEEKLMCFTCDFFEV